LGRCWARNVGLAVDALGDSALVPVL